METWKKTSIQRVRFELLPSAFQVQSDKFNPENQILSSF